AHDLDPVGSLRLGRRHLGKTRVDAVRREAEIGARLFSALGIGREGARDQVVLSVHAGAEPMDAADERAAPAAHHAEPQRLDHRQAMPSIRRFAAWSVPAPAKSSNAWSVTRMMRSAMNFAPSRAPSSG